MLVVANDTIILAIAAMKFMTMIYIYILHNNNKEVLMGKEHEYIIIFLATIPTDDVFTNNNNVRASLYYRIEK